MTKKKLIYMLLEVLFIAIVPLILVLFTYSNLGQEAFTFKFTFIGILLVIVIFFVLKRTFLDKKLKALELSSIQTAVDFKNETDEKKKAKLKSSLRYYRTLQAVVGAVLPILIFITAIIACKALEQELVSLSSTIGLCLVSFVIGTLFNVLSCREVK